ncbi:hypothetical protein [Biostraticola tofi]|uniref:hypothetical protein n=1 Tax=Biostraticola tofi TaxID=466109 RepID=UPI001404A5C2|nr:hypothetical protein [Biostraticola tofi]
MAFPERTLVQKSVLSLLQVIAVNEQEKSGVRVILLNSLASAESGKKAFEHKEED